MIRQILLAGALLSAGIAGAQKCSYGDCQNSFGILETADWGKIGFFSEGKLNGTANRSSQTDWYSGEWKNDLKNGFFVYNESGDFKFGYFVNDKKQGLHVTYMKNDRETFENGVSKGVQKYASNGQTSGCVSGDCQAGFGVMMEGNGNSMTGNFKNGKLEGMGVIINMQSGLSIYGEFKEGFAQGPIVIQSLNGMVMIGRMNSKQKEGQFVTLNPDGTVSGELFQAGQSVRTF